VLAIGSAAFIGVTLILYFIIKYRANSTEKKSKNDTCCTRRLQYKIQLIAVKDNVLRVIVCNLFKSEFVISLRSLQLVCPASFKFEFEMTGKFALLET